MLNFWGKLRVSFKLIQYAKALYLDLFAIVALTLTLNRSVSCYTVLRALLRLYIKELLCAYSLIFDWFSNVDDVVQTLSFKCVSIVRESNDTRRLCSKQVLKHLQISHNGSRNELSRIKRVQKVWQVFLAKCHHCLRNSFCSVFPRLSIEVSVFDVHQFVLSANANAVQKVSEDF